MPVHRPVGAKRADNRPRPGRPDNRKHQDPPDTRDRLSKLRPRQRVPEPDHPVGTTRHDTDAAIWPFSNRERQEI
jgi:hypothetical protein